MNQLSGYSASEPPEQTLESASGVNPGIKTDNPGDAGGDIVATLDQNEAVSPVSKQAKPETGKGPAWRKEPISNFKLDADGNVELRGNGSPVRRGGKPAKPKPGDMLADGTTYGVAPEGKPEHVSVSRVVVPDEQQQQQAGPQRQVGPAFGRLLSRLGFKAAERRGGAKWKPDDDEAELIGEAAAETFGNRSVPWWLVLPIAVAAYVVARIEFEKRESSNSGDNSHLHNGSDTERQDTASTPARPGGIW